MKIYDNNPNDTLLINNGTLSDETTVVRLKQNGKKVLYNNLVNKDHHTKIKLNKRDITESTYSPKKENGRILNKEVTLNEKSSLAIPKNEFLDANGKFSGRKFVDYLKHEGKKVVYNDLTTEREELPPFYDRVKYNRALEVFQKYKFNILLKQLTGLLLILADDVAIKMLLMFNKTNTTEVALARYKIIMKHLLALLDTDFNKDSKFWKSIHEVNRLHRLANIQASKTNNVPQISQFELSGTVSCLVSFSIFKPECFGLSDITRDEQEALLHYWRVIGYLLGVEDRFNICRESVDETQEILEILIERHVKPRLELKDTNSIGFQVTAIKAISRCTLPMNPKVMLNFAYEILYSDPEQRKRLEFALGPKERIYSFLLTTMRNLLHYSFFRSVMNKIFNYIL